MPCVCTPGAYGCTPKSRIPASGCGPRTIPDLRDHPISRTTAPEGQHRRSLAPGQKEAEEPLTNNDNHSSVTDTLAVVVNPTDETGDQEIRQSTRTQHNTRHNANATHQIDPNCIGYTYHPTCRLRMKRETRDSCDDQGVAIPPQPGEAQRLKQPAPPPAARAMTDENYQSQKSPSLHPRWSTGSWLR